MISWNNLKNINYKLYRKPEIENKYKLFQKRILKTHNSIYEYILNNVICNKKIHIMLNKFPYHIEKNVTHWIIWNKGNYNKNIYKKIIFKIFNPKYYDIIFRINKLEDRSIPEIGHCHIFIKLKNTKN